MQLIIPMSGLGERFLKVGYKVPKPLIYVEEKPIIAHIVDMFPGVESIFFICNKNHLLSKDLKMRETLLKIKPNSKIISIDQHKKGPIHAVLSSINYFDLEKPTIVNYCDFNCIWDYNKFSQYVRDSKCDGCVVTYKGFHPHMLVNTNYAYLKVNNSNITDIQEKKPFTSKPMDEHASSGTYYFKTGALMDKYFNKTVKEDLHVNGEYYVSMSFKPMIKDNLNLRVFNLRFFMQWGTPEDLKDYEWYSNMFKKKLNHNKKKEIIQNTTLLIPCAGIGSRFVKEGYKKPKPFIKVSGKIMLLQAINDLPLCHNTKVIFRNDMDDLNISIYKLKKYFPKIEIKLLNKKTDGQAITCLEGLDKNNMNSSLIISACDNGLIYSKNFLNLIKDNSIDIVVWGCRRYPGAIKKPEMYGWIDEEYGKIKKIHVKKQSKDKFNDPIITGTFYFRESSIFQKITFDLIKGGKKVNNEFYIDSCINNAINLGYSVRYFEVDYFLCWGTPDDLKTYKYWQECFNDWDCHDYKKSLDEDF